MASPQVFVPPYILTLSVALLLLSVFIQAILFIGTHLLFVVCYGVRIKESPHKIGLQYV